MNILTLKKINCEKYIDRLEELDISKIQFLEYHILDTSRVYVNYPTRKEVNYGDLYVNVAFTYLTSSFNLEKFILKAYIAIHIDYPIDSIHSRIKSYFTDTNLIPIKPEEVENQFKQWFKEEELQKMDINFLDIKEAVKIGEIDFYGDNDYYGYNGFIVFVTSEKIYFVNFFSNI